MYGVHRTCADTAAVSCGTSHASAVSTPRYSKTRYKKLVTHVESCEIAVSLLESGEQRYIKDTFSVTVTQYLLPCTTTHSVLQSLNMYRLAQRHIQCYNHSTFTALSLSIYCLAQQHDALSVAQRHIQRYSHSTLVPFTRINSASQPFNVFPFPQGHGQRYSRFTQHSSRRIQTQLRTFPFSTRVSLHPPYAPGSRCTKGKRACRSVHFTANIVATLSLR